MKHIITIFALTCCIIYLFFANKDDVRVLKTTSETRHEGGILLSNDQFLSYTDTILVKKHLIGNKKINIGWFSSDPILVKREVLPFAGIKHDMFVTNIGALSSNYWHYGKMLSTISNTSEESNMERIVGILEKIVEGGK